MSLWSPAWLLSWLPPWMPLESVYLIATALALYLVRLLAWLWFRWRTRREWIAGRKEYERRMRLEHERREIHAYRQRIAEAGYREAVNAHQEAARPPDHWRQANQ